MVIVSSVHSTVRKFVSGTERKRRSHYVGVSSLFCPLGSEYKTTTNCQIRTLTVEGGQKHKPSQNTQDVFRQ